MFALNLSQWSPNTVVLWDNRILAHVRAFVFEFVRTLEVTFQSAIIDYGESKERRHGARITPQAERPIPALNGLELDS